MEEEQRSEQQQTPVSQEQPLLQAGTGGQEDQQQRPPLASCAAAAIQTVLPPLPPLMTPPYPGLAAQAGGKPLPVPVQGQRFVVPQTSLTFEQQVQLQHDVAHESQHPTIAELQARLLDVQRQQQQLRDAQRQQDLQ